MYRELYIIIIIVIELKFIIFLLEIFLEKDEINFNKLWNYSYLIECNFSVGCE